VPPWKYRSDSPARRRLLRELRSLLAREMRMPPLNSLLLFAVLHEQTKQRTRVFAKGPCASSSSLRPSSDLPGQISMRIWGIKSGLARYQCRFALASLMTASTRALGNRGSADVNRHNRPKAESYSKDREGGGRILTWFADEPRNPRR